jgi:hypothetical protein
MEYGHEIQWAKEKLNSILLFKLNIYVMLVIIISNMAFIPMIIPAVTLSLQNNSSLANKNSTHPSNPPLVFRKRLTLSSCCQQGSGLFQVNQGFCAQRTAALSALTLPSNQITP